MDPPTYSHSFIKDGFKAGDQIRVQGSASSDGYYTLHAVNHPSLILDEGDAFSAAGAGPSITVTAATTATWIIIGGTAGSVVIGPPTKITVLNPSTYSLPMTVMVTDSAGNPMPGAIVSLSAWPLQYSSGVWYDRNDDPKIPIMSPTLRKPMTMRTKMRT